MSGVAFFPRRQNSKVPMYTYDSDFYRSINSGSTRAAEVIVPLVRNMLQKTPASVLDMGCGAGAWLEIWQLGGSQIMGVDGPYIQESDLLIPATAFHPHDLRSPLQLEKQFDLAQCLEVAEHLPEESAGVLVDSLCSHSDVVLFSAAPPGQGGENHINEQPYSYWRDQFAARGYDMIDAIRPAIQSELEVKPWYRHNSFLFVRASVLENSLAHLLDYRIPMHEEPVDVSSWWYRQRKRIIGMLPTRMSTMIATGKKRLHNQLYRRSA